MAFITAFNATKSLEELEEDFYNSERTDIDELLNSNGSLIWSVGSKASVGDKVFIYCAKYAASNFNPIRNQAKETNDQKLIDFAEEQYLKYQQYSGCIVAVGKVAEEPYLDGDENKQSNWKAEINHITLLKQRIHIDDFRDFIYITRGATITKLSMEQDAQLEELITNNNQSKTSSKFTSNELHKTGTYSSWTIKNEKIAIKSCDKSFFEYRGSTIPREVYWFFGAEDIKTGGKKNIQLSYNGELYNAYLQREIHELQRIRIFWHQDLAEEFEKYNDPDNTTSLVFCKTGSTTYDVSFSADASLDKTSNDGEDEALLPEEIMEDEQESIIEGAKKKITVNAYERDPKAKKKCKDYYMRKDGRIICQVCGFDFGKVYGSEYANMIHVHHIVPISEIGEEYVVDPVKDLIPVCPNCHMILHAGKGISVTELKKKIKNN